MRIDLGAQAPDFQARSWDGTDVALSDFRGRKLWLAFFRYASCPLCNLQVRKILVRWDALQAKGLSLLAVFQSPAASIAEYVGQQAPPFPLIADPEERLYRLYGLETSLAGFLSPRNMVRVGQALKAGFKPGRTEGSKTRIPGDFLVDGDGRVRDAYYGEVIADHIPFERVEAFIAGAKSA
jgi:peroxiredoxin